MVLFDLSLLVNFLCLQHTVFQMKIHFVLRPLLLEELGCFLALFASEDSVDFFSFSILELLQRLKRKDLVKIYGSIMSFLLFALLLLRILHNREISTLQFLLLKVLSLTKGGNLRFNRAPLHIHYIVPLMTSFFYKVCNLFLLV